MAFCSPTHGTNRFKRTVFPLGGLFGSYLRAFMPNPATCLKLHPVYGQPNLVYRQLSIYKCLFTRLWTPASVDAPPPVYRSAILKTAWAVFSRPLSTDGGVCL